MHDRTLLNELSVFFQFLDDRLVGVFAEQADIVRHGLEKACFSIERVDQVDSGLTTNPKIILSISRSDMHDARAVFGRHEAIFENHESAQAICLFCVV